MKKIWVCGASGMLGSHFSRILTRRKVAFVANDYQQVDITRLEDVSEFVCREKVTHIINCAAYTAVDQAEHEQAQAYLINAMGPANLGKVGKRYGASVVHFSTDYVFDGKATFPYKEDHPCSPLGAYGLSKWAGEIKLLDEHPYACIIRTSWLYGLPGKNFVETMLRLMKEKEFLRVVADQMGKPTYCQDLAEAALEISEESGIFHFANAFETNWYLFAKEIYQQANQLGYSLKVQKIEPITTQEYPTPACRPNYSTLSTKKIEQLLRQPPRPWQEALREYLETYKSHYENSISG